MMPVLDLSLLRVSVLNIIPESYDRLKHWADKFPGGLFDFA